MYDSALVMWVGVALGLGVYLYIKREWPFDKEEKGGEENDGK